MRDETTTPVFPSFIRLPPQPSDQSSLAASPPPEPDCLTEGEPQLYFRATDCCTAQQPHILLLISALSTLSQLCLKMTAPLQPQKKKNERFRADAAYRTACEPLRGDAPWCQLGAPASATMPPTREANRVRSDNARSPSFPFLVFKGFSSNTVPLSVINALPPFPLTRTLISTFARHHSTNL